MGFFFPFVEIGIRFHNRQKTMGIITALLVAGCQFKAWGAGPRKGREHYHPQKGILSR